MSTLLLGLHITIPWSFWSGEHILVTCLKKKNVEEMYFICQQKAFKYGFYELNSKIVKYFAERDLSTLW